MKQHITKEIVNIELNDIQRSRLKCSLDHVGEWDGSFIKDPGLSIGQMIEFLESELNMFPEIETYTTGQDIYNGFEGRKIYEIYTYDEAHRAETLCDALWEAVKHVLNETK